MKKKVVLCAYLNFQKKTSGFNYFKRMLKNVIFMKELVKNQQLIIFG